MPLDPARIREGIRIALAEAEEGRDLDPTEAATRRVRFRENGAYDRKVAAVCLRQDDHRLAAKKSWASFANAIQAACAAEGVLVTWDRDLVRISWRLMSHVREADAAAGNTLDRGFMAGRTLLQHFHEDILPSDFVPSLVAEVMDAVALLDSAVCETD